MNPKDDAAAREIERLRSLPAAHRRPVYEPPNPMNPLDRRNSPYPWALGLEIATGHPLMAAVTGLFWWFRGRPKPPR